MKILINPDFFYIRDIYFPSKKHLLGLKAQFEKLFYGEKVELKYIISEQMYYQFNKKEIDKLDYILISDVEVRKAFNDNYIAHYKAVEKFYLGDLSDEQFENFKKLYNEKLGNYIPDIIFSFEYVDKVLEYIFPTTLHFSYSGGLFKRNFGIPSFVLDPKGSIKTSSLNVFKEEISKLKLSQKDDEIIEKFKSEIRNLLTINNPNSELIKKYKEKFDYLLLLPLQINFHYSTNTETEHKTQYDIVNYVLENVPKNVGVIVTEHDHNQFMDNAAIENGGFLSWFENKFENFIYIKDEQKAKFKSTSLSFLPYVDGIINLSSTIAWTGLLFDLKIISIAKYNNDYCKDIQELKGILDVLKLPKKNKNNLIYWMLTRYFVFEDMLLNNRYFILYLKRKLKEYSSKEIDFKFFDERVDISTICNLIISKISYEAIKINFYQQKWHNLKAKYNIVKNKIKALIHTIKLLFIGYWK